MFHCFSSVYYKKKTLWLSAVRVDEADPVWPPQPLHSIPAEKVMKKPIPEEHMILKTTFEGLIQKCLAVATDPVRKTTQFISAPTKKIARCSWSNVFIVSQQTKRKLDDANKRLEALYDKLREQTVSDHFNYKKTTKNWRTCNTQETNSRKEVTYNTRQTRKCLGIWNMQMSSETLWTSSRLVFV